MNTQTCLCKFTIEENCSTQKKTLKLNCAQKRNGKHRQFLFAPLAPVTTKAGAMVRAFNTGAAIFEGFKIESNYAQIAPLSRNKKNEEIKTSSYTYVSTA